MLHAVSTLYQPEPETDTNIYLDRKPGLYLKQTPGKGRGVFCTTDIKKGDTIETTPALVLVDEESPHAEETILNNYVFKIGEISDELREHLGIADIEAATCVVMGIGSYCNHDEQPNAQILWEETEDSLYYSLEAITDIPAGTEICTTYGETWFSDREE